MKSNGYPMADAILAKKKAEPPRPLSPFELADIQVGMIKGQVQVHETALRGLSDAMTGILQRLAREGGSGDKLAARFTKAMSDARDAAGALADRLSQAEAKIGELAEWILAPSLEQKRFTRDRSGAMIGWESETQTPAGTLVERATIERKGGKIVGVKVERGMEV